MWVKCEVKYERNASKQKPQKEYFHGVLCVLTLLTLREIRILFAWRHA